MKDNTANQSESSVERNEDQPRTDAASARGPLNSRLDRRAFLTGMGMGSAAFLLSPLHLPAAFMSSGRELLACIGTFGQTDKGTLHLLQVRDGKSKVLDSLPSVRPSALVRHPFHSIVYVANGVTEYQYQPRGTVEAFSVDPSSGRLQFLGRQALSLSATSPKSLSVSPDGRNLLVAAFGGGAYNVLPVDDTGLPGAPSTILKQLGHGEHATEQTSAHPAHVLFHPQGQLAIAADYGADRLDILTAGTENADGSSFKVAARLQCAAGSGPRGIALHGNGRLLAVAHGLRPSLATFRIAPDGNLQPLAHAAMSSAPTAVCFHPEQDVLYTAQNRGVRGGLLKAWRVDPRSGSLRPVGQINLPVAEVTAIHSVGSTLWLASNRGLLTAELNPESGEPYRAGLTVAIPHAHSFAIFQ